MKWHKIHEDGERPQPGIFMLAWAAEKKCPICVALGDTPTNDLWEAMCNPEAMKIVTHWAQIEGPAEFMEDGNE